MRTASGRSLRRHHFDDPGNGIAGFSGDNGKAKAALIAWPVGIVFDAKGNLIFSDQGNNRVRKIDTKGVITTIAAMAPPVLPVMAERLALPS